MKRLGLFFIAAGFAGNTFAQKPGAIIDVQHYDFSVTLSDSTNNIKGKATIDLLFVKDAQRITLDLINKNSNGRGMTVLQVTENNKPLSFTHSDNALNIDFGTTIKSGKQKSITVLYQGIPADGLIISNNKFGHRVYFADNWPNRARNWIPCVDDPADKALVDFTVTAPDHLQVVANGIKKEETVAPGHTRITHYSETTPISTKIMVVGVADFAVEQSGTVNNTPIYSWVYPEEKDKGFYDYALAVNILPFFIKNVGPYGFKKLANVESTTIFGGMENAGAIFYSEETSITGTRKSESLLAHEIAHQWFGDMATEAGFSHLWLSEGFATYMTVLYFENKYGTDTARFMLSNNRKVVINFAHKKLRPVVDSTVTNYMDLLNANSYQKGGWVLHMLRRQLGDSLFWKGIRTYYSRFAGKNAVTADLCKAMEDASARNLEGFFHQWLFEAGHPQLNMQWKYNNDKKEIELTVTQQQQPLFQFPLELSINGELKPVMIKDRQSLFTFPVTEKPTSVIADPQVNLLYEGTLTENK